jgi:hypothetical protein
MGYFGCCFNCRVAWDGKIVISNRVIFKWSGLLGNVIVKSLRWVQIWSCPFVTRHSTTKLRVAEWRWLRVCNFDARRRWTVFSFALTAGKLVLDLVAKWQIPAPARNRTPDHRSVWLQRYPRFCKDWWKWRKNRQPESWHVLELVLWQRINLSVSVKGRYIREYLFHVVVKGLIYLMWLCFIS